MAIEFKEHCMAAEGPGRSLWVREHAPALAGAADAAPPHPRDRGSSGVQPALAGSGPVVPVCPFGAFV